MREFYKERLGTQNRQLEVRREEKKKCSYKDFAACQPPMYLGDTNPTISMRWVCKMEAAFRTSHCDDEDKVNFASNSLRGVAKTWWDLEVLKRGNEDIQALSWEQFKEEFLKNFVPRTEIKRIKEEFHRMEQTTETVNEFTSKVLELARFLPEYAKDERALMEAYFLMLKPELQDNINTDNYEKMEDVVADIRDKELNLERRASRINKRKTETPTIPSKKPKFVAVTNKEVMVDIPTCVTCGKRHGGICRFGGKGCYKCGQLGHLSPDCPRPTNVCYHCLKPGHMKSECPYLKRGGRTVEPQRVKREQEQA